MPLLPAASAFCPHDDGDWLSAGMPHHEPKACIRRLTCTAADCLLTSDLASAAAPASAEEVCQATDKPQSMYNLAPAASGTAAQADADALADVMAAGAQLAQVSCWRNQATDWNSFSALRIVITAY